MHLSEIYHESFLHCQLPSHVYSVFARNLELNKYRSWVQLPKWLIRTELSSHIILLLFFNLKGNEINKELNIPLVLPPLDPYQGYLAWIRPHFPLYDEDLVFHHSVYYFQLARIHISTTLTIFDIGLFSISWHGIILEVYRFCFEESRVLH